VETAAYAGIENEAIDATQSGPLLVLDGKINAQLNPRSLNRNIRSGVGVLDRETAIFAISREPVTFYEFADLFIQMLKCPNALYLDGAISKMYLPEIGRMEADGDFAGIIGIEEQVNK
jgi:uncharacterized protein YigE (DUF2233 family)